MASHLSYGVLEYLNTTLIGRWNENDFHHSDWITCSAPLLVFFNISPYLQRNLGYSVLFSPFPFENSFSVLSPRFYHHIQQNSLYKAVQIPSQDLDSSRYKYCSTIYIASLQFSIFAIVILVLVYLLGFALLNNACTNRQSVSQLISSRQSKRKYKISVLNKALQKSVAN